MLECEASLKVQTKFIETSCCSVGKKMELDGRRPDLVDTERLGVLCNVMHRLNVHDKQRRLSLV